MPESDLFYEISALMTEQKNPNTLDIDIAGTGEILYMINDEDSNVAPAVRAEIPNIQIAVDKIVEAFRGGGRLFYVGAGTSGRLGIVDASECPPTFGTDPEMVQGIIAGGHKAVFKAQEGAEDKPEKGAEAIEEYAINEKDVVCGIAASGRTPFVLGALEEASRRGAYTILVTTSSREQLKDMCISADTLICPNVGPEVIAGSTRMKSGTAQKLVLNMLTTASMVRLGKTLGNVMIDLQMSNAKLKERAKRIIMQLTGIGYDEAEKYLAESNWSVKIALVMILGDTSAELAEKYLIAGDGFIRKALQLARKK